MNDTSPEMEARYRAMLLARSPQERLRMADSMFSSARRLVVASVLAADPAASPAAVRRGLFLRFYGHEFDTAVRARIVARLSMEDDVDVSPAQRGVGRVGGRGDGGRSTNGCETGSARNA